VKMNFLAQQEMHDPRWDALVRSFKTRNRAGRLQTALDIAEIAGIWWDHQHHWCEFEDAHGIVRLRRGRKPESKFHPICRHLSGLGVGGDETGRASVMATVLDVWEKTGIAPAEIPAWIAGTKGGIRAIYDQAVHHPARNDNVYTGNVLPSRRVDWAITNPPFSDAYAAIAARAFMISENVAFLVKLNVALGTYARHRAWREAGHGLREIVFIPWADAEFITEDGRDKAGEGFCLALLHWSRGWKGGVRLTYWDNLGRLAEAAD
jgi:hypothetical protein